MTAKGWWRVAVSSHTVSQLDKIKDHLEEITGEKSSYNKIIDLLIKSYQRESSRR